VEEAKLFSDTALSQHWITHLIISRGENGFSELGRCSISEEKKSQGDDQDVI
jgi:hypothetical protein